MTWEAGADGSSGGAGASVFVNGAGAIQRGCFSSITRGTSAVR